MQPPPHSSLPETSGGAAPPSPITPPVACTILLLVPTSLLFIQVHHLPALRPPYKCRLACLPVFTVPRPLIIELSFSYLNAQSRKGVRDFRREDWGREGGQCGLTATSIPMDLCSRFLLTTYYPGPSPALSRVRTHRPLTSSRHSCYCFCFMVINTPRPRPRQPRCQPEDSMLSFRGKSRRSSPWRQDGSGPQRSPRLHTSLKDEGEQKQWWCPAHESLWVWGTLLKVAEQ